MSFSFASNSSTEKIITYTVTSTNSILEHKEITFQITVTNRSRSVRIENLQLQDDFKHYVQQ